MYWSGWDWWITRSQSGHVFFSSRCCTRQLLQTKTQKARFIDTKVNQNIDNETKVKFAVVWSVKLAISAVNSHVCRHSTIVVASMKYPLHILHVINGFRGFNLIFLSISTICVFASLRAARVRKMTRCKTRGRDSNFECNVGE